jgi:hypothetical protein
VHPCQACTSCRPFPPPRFCHLALCPAHPHMPGTYVTSSSFPALKVAPLPSPSPLTPPCYGWLAVVSDMDNEGVCPECQWWKDARAGLYQSPYNRAVRMMVARTHKGMNALSKRRGWYCSVGTRQVVQSNE